MSLAAQERSLSELVTSSTNRVGWKWLLKLGHRSPCNIHFICWNTFGALSCHAKNPRPPCWRGPVWLLWWTVSAGPSLLAIFAQVPDLRLGCLVPTRPAHPPNVYQCVSSMINRISQPSAFVTHKITSYNKNKWLFSATPFWGGLLCSSRITATILIYASIAFCFIPTVA